MKRRRKLRVNIVDEARLQDRGGFYLASPRFIITAAAFALFFIALGAALISFTPLRRSLPGFLNSSEKDATLEAIIRLDSLRDNYNVNQRYIDNLLTVLDTDRAPGDTVAITQLENEMTVDSLLQPSERETAFIERMQEEKYNVNIVAPLAAEGVRFYPVNPEAVFADNSRESSVARVVMPLGSSIHAIAQGRVLDISRSPLSAGYDLIIQHPNGFVSKISNAGSPLVGAGDLVEGNQPLAMTAKGRNNTITLEIWHNGNPLVPYRYSQHDETP